jgi:hypothetical protein
MTEAEWLSSADPRAMLEVLRDNGKLSDRKARLFGAATARRLWPLLTDGHGRKAVEAAERYADGLEGPSALAAARRGALAAVAPGEIEIDPAAAAWLHAALLAYHLATGAEEVPPERLAALAALNGSAAASWQGPAAQAAEERAQADLLRCLFGPRPLRPPPPPALAVLTWGDGLIPRLARAAYDSRLLPGGELDAARLTVLADALEESGCGDAELVLHLRGPGPHVRGCFVIDLILFTDR